MTLPSDVFDDLLTIYLAGEASPGTRSLVEERARTDEAFAGRIAAARGLALTAEATTSQPDTELAALGRTRQFIRLRTVFFAAAIFFTLVPLSIVGDEQGVRFLILGQHDRLVWSFWGIAVASWVACWVMHRSVREAGI